MNTSSGTRSPSLRTEITDFFQTTIRAYFATHQRELPWRETRDPYAILVSEMMLQQTGVERVRPKYLAFIERFPNLPTLAESPFQDVLLTWQGLGYNRRAVALHQCAKAIVDRYEGIVPASVDALQSLPGIGPYTARAIAAFAFGTPLPFIETNIRAVFIHWFFADRVDVTDREILPIVAETLDMADPRSWYYALMDYGAMLKHTHPNPGKRSAHHIRQTPFKGSNRELRSRILRAIMELPGLNADEIAERLEADVEAVRKNLVSMEKEGILQRKEKGYVV